jgi:hypothetical protein
LRLSACFNFSAVANFPPIYECFIFSSACSQNRAVQTALGEHPACLNTWKLIGLSAVPSAVSRSHSLTSIARSLNVSADTLAHLFCSREIRSRSTTWKPTVLWNLMIKHRPTNHMDSFVLYSLYL